MSQAKEKYFELLVREESTVKYTIRANDEEQAQRIFDEHSQWYSDQHRQVVAQDRFVIDRSPLDKPPF